MHKNKKFVDEDFERIKANIQQIQDINANYDPNETMPQELVERENNEFLIGGNGGMPEPTDTETQTEGDMSMSMQNVQPGSGRPRGLEF